MIDPVTRRWSDGLPLGVARSGHALERLGTRLVAFGGIYLFGGAGAGAAGSTLSFRIP